MLESPWKSRPQLQSPLEAAVTAARLASQREKTLTTTTLTMINPTTTEGTSFEAARTQWERGAQRRAEAEAKREAVALAFGRCFGRVGERGDEVEARLRRHRHEDEALRRVVLHRSATALQHRLRCDAALTKLAEAWARAAAASRASVAALSTARTALTAIVEEDIPMTDDDAIDRAAKATFLRFAGDRQEVPMTLFPEMIEDLGEGFHGDALDEEMVKVDPTKTGIVSLDAFLNWYRNLVDNNDDDDEDQDDDVAEEREAALDAYDRYTEALGLTSVPSVKFSGLLESLGTTYCQEDHDRYLAPLVESGAIGRTKFADWYAVWVTGDDGDDYEYDDDVDDDRPTEEEEARAAMMWAELTKPKAGQWKCPSCSVMNDENALKCVACETPNPYAASLPKAPSLPKASMPSSPFGGFSFQPPTTATTTQPAAAPASSSGFSFQPPTTTTTKTTQPGAAAATSSSGFSFQPPTTTTTTQPAAAATSSSGFSFQPPTTQPAATSGFSFQPPPTTQPAATTSFSSTSGGGGFTFQPAVDQKATGFGGTTTTTIPEKDDDSRAKVSKQNHGFVFAPPTITGTGFRFDSSAENTSVTAAKAALDVEGKDESDAERMAGETFDEYDADKTGVITMETFEAVLDDLGEGFFGDEMDRQKMLVDPDETGQVTRDAFVTYYVQKLTGGGDDSDDDEEILEEEREAARAAFDALATSSGTLPKDKFQKLIESFGTVYCEEEHVKTLAKLTDGTETIDRDAFVEWYAYWVTGLGDDDDDDDDDEDDDARPTEEEEARAAAMWAELSKPKAGQWKCPECAVTNAKDAAKCVACEFPNPYAAAKTTAEKKRPSPASAQPSDFNFGAPMNDPPALTGFTFGGPPAADPVTPKKESFSESSSFSFGGGKPNPKPKDFTFSSSDPPDEEKKSFSFGLPLNAERPSSPMVQPADKAFTFGGAGKSTTFTAAPPKPPAPSGFQFTTTTTSSSSGSSSGFSFQVPPSQTVDLNKNPFDPPSKARPVFSFGSSSGSK